MEAQRNLRLRDLMKSVFAPACESCGAARAGAYRLVDGGEGHVRHLWICSECAQRAVDHGLRVHPRSSVVPFHG
jgi:hypothetical protein